jgi:hypothetical protein
MTGTNRSLMPIWSAAAARVVGPPQGNMFIVTAASAVTDARASGLMPAALYSGSMAGIVTMNVLAPAPSRWARAAMAAVPRLMRTGSRWTTRRSARMSGSNRPASFITPK